MPALNYPELQHVPAACISTRPWHLDAVQVRARYGNVDEAVVELVPPINVSWPSAQYDLFAGDAKYDQNKVGALGYDSAFERDAIKELRSKAMVVKTPSAVYPGEVKAAITSLGQKAYDLFGEVYAIYATYATGGNVTYPLYEKYGDQVVYKAFPLSVPENQIVGQLDPDLAGIWQPARAGARQQIRAKLHKAIHLLWCAMYGRAQAEAWQQNKTISDAKPAGPKLTAGTPLPKTTPGTVTATPVPPGPEGGAGPLPPPPTPTTPTEGMPLASKVMLGGAAALALAAGVRRMFFVSAAPPR